MDKFTQKHLLTWIYSRFARNNDEIFDLFLSHFNSLDKDEQDYILNNGWAVLERAVREAKKGELNKLEFQ
jgi:hypothetical protein